MTAQFITRGVWKSITASAKAARKPALVAVAYFGQGASKLMRLPAGSRLVVDASEGAVKSGQTHPADLIRLQKRGVVIYG
jgi:phosphatidylserine/phosphatidylglycerophosphate/cardiolipin synthase-like enzyme